MLMKSLGEDVFCSYNSSSRDEGNNRRARNINKDFNFSRESSKEIQKTGKPMLETRDVRNEEQSDDGIAKIIRTNQEIMSLIKHCG